MAEQWVKKQQACLHNTSSHLYLCLPALLRGDSVKHMSWVWDVFSHIHDIESWVMLETLANSTMGLALQTQANVALGRIPLVVAGLDNEADRFNIFDLPASHGLKVHAEVQQLFYLQLHPPCRYPYIGISFPPCRHCALMLAHNAVSYKGRAVLCEHRGCSGKLYGSWTAADYMAGDVVTAFLGPQLRAQLDDFQQVFEWASSEQTTVAAQIQSPIGSTHAVDNMSSLAMCLVTEELKSVQKWLVCQGAAPMIEGSLSQS